MSTKQFCDRCDVEITQQKSGAVNGVEDADEQGNGTITDSADLCPRCYHAFKDWLASKVLPAATRR